MRVPLGEGREFDLIRGFLGDSDSLPKSVLVGPGDDCTVLEGGVVVSVDLSVEEVHFRRSWVSFQEAGYRAAVAGLSDLAAMAAEPIGVLVSLAVDPHEVVEVGKALNAGVVEAAHGAGVPVLGGDLSRSPGPAVVDIVAIGRSSDPLLRSGCEPGDEIWVTGRLGGSRAAVAAWEGGSEPIPALRDAFARPTPRIREALWLAERVDLHAGIDLSDGLAGDAGHLATASGVALILDADALPFFPDLLATVGGEREAQGYALRGGEDYELCVSAAPGALGPLRAQFEREFGIPLTCVGRAVEGQGVRIEGSSGDELKDPRGFSHFQGGDSG